jgi:hypothetical protein
MNLKIFCGAHKYVSYLNNLNSVIQPIGNGKNFFQNNWLVSNKDDNISHKHLFYGELVGQYWVWKNYIKSNLEQDSWIGFSQYRRHWVGKEPLKNRLLYNYLIDRFIKIIINKIASSRYSFYNKGLVKFYRNYSHNSLNIPIKLGSLKNFILDDSSLLSDYFDVVLPKPYFMNENVNQQFCNIAVLDKDCWGEIVSYLPQNMQQKFIYSLSNKKEISGHNMYIAKPKVLDEYFTFLFGYLEKIENIFNKKTNKKLIEMPRFFGGFSERIADFWFKEYKKYTYLPVYYIKDV